MQREFPASLKQPRTRAAAAALLTAMLILPSGCKHTNATALAYGEAINAYYDTHPACLWPDPVRFPVQVDSKDAARTAGYDALVDQGFLLRSTDEKERFLIGTKQVTNYDLNDRGHSAWTPDPTQPGYGNFCYGHRNVQTIDESAPSATTAEVVHVRYHYRLIGTPPWALAQETQTAFPALATALSATLPGSDVLVHSGAAWQVQPATPAGQPVHAADGKIVE